MKYKLTLRPRTLVLLCVGMLFTLLLAAVPASAGDGHDDDRFLSLPPDLSTEYLEGHYKHRDPQHPKLKYWHRKLKTATDHGVDRFRGEIERIPKGEFCNFPVRVRTWGTEPWWNWERNGRIVHEVFFPDLRSKWSANGKSFWTIDEGWDYVWLNRDGSAFIEGTGTHFWAHNKRFRYRQYGTWHLLFGEEPGAALYEKYFHDKTSVWDGTIDDTVTRVCRFLAKKK